MVQEGDYLAVFNSSHRIMKAESILKARGIPILLIPAPRQLMTDCGLALRISPDFKVEALRILFEEQVSPAFVSRYKNGSYHTVQEACGDLSS